MGVFSKKKDAKKDITPVGSPTKQAATIPLPPSPIKQAPSLSRDDDDDDNDRDDDEEDNIAVPVPAATAAAAAAVAEKSTSKLGSIFSSKKKEDAVTVTVDLDEKPSTIGRRASSNDKDDRPKKPRNRCCCLFHMPTSIVLLIVLLLVNDVWFAWYSMNQRGQATSLIESMKDTYFQHGSAAAAMRLKELRVLLDANVVVALVDMLFTMVGLAGVDIEGFKLFLMFTLWKFAQFGFSVSSSVITTTLWQKYNAAPGDTSAPNLSDKLVKWEVGISAAGLVVELYFLVLICIFANYLRNLKNWRQATGRE